MGWKTKEEGNAYKKRHYEAKKATRAALGLCFSCDRPPLPGMIRCEECSASNRLQNNNIRRSYVDSGLCARCGRPAVEGLTQCAECSGQTKNSYDAARQQALDHYGRACACCGEAEELFLCFDHVNNDGSKHRKAEKVVNFAKWAVRNGFPSGFQTLCYNCNFGKHLNGGVCPHETKRQQRPTLVCVASG